jgi:hypothetical protein
MLQSDRTHEPVLERSGTLWALDRAATVIGMMIFVILIVTIPICHFLVYVMTLSQLDRLYICNVGREYNLLLCITLNTFH